MHKCKIGNTNLKDLSKICRNKLTESEAMAMAITRHAALKSRMASAPAPESTASVLEMAKLDVAKQRQKAQVVLRNPSLSKVKCVKPIKPRGGSLHSTMNGVKPSNIPVNSSRPQSKSFLQTNGGRIKLVTPRLPWNAGKVQSKTDSGLYNRTAQRASLVISKDPSPKPRRPSNYIIPADQDKPPNNSTSNIPSHVTDNVVMRRSKQKSANSEAITEKRRSRSLESLMNSSSAMHTYLTPTQCFKCRKDMSRVLDSSASDRFSDANSSTSDLNCSLPELPFDQNNNVVTQVTNHKLSVPRAEVLKAEKLIHHPPPVDIVSDTECYQYHFESDSQAESDYGTAVASDSEVYRYRSKIKDKRNLHLDSPNPHLLREHRAESAGSIRERKTQIEQDLDSLLDSMAFALGNYQSNTKSDPDNVGGSEDSLYTPPAFFRPIFEVKI